MRLCLWWTSTPVTAPTSSPVVNPMSTSGHSTLGSLPRNKASSDITGDVLTGDSEGNILPWTKSAADTKTLGKGAKETYQIVRPIKAHEGSVFTLCALRCGSLLSGGGKDRKIIRWSADLAPERECEIPEKFGAVRTVAVVDDEEILVGTTRNAILRGSFSDGFVAIVQGHLDEMWGLATHPSQDIFLSCSHDRQVCLWNTEKHNLDWCITLE
ncbi:hypothetical protein XENOCAPTIV_013459, partial [Xenoophorus captivus]